MDKYQPAEQETPSRSNSRWRLAMAHRIAAELDAQEFGVAGFYLFGDTKNREDSPLCTINVLIHFRGTVHQREKLDVWLEGWSLCLDECNYSRTGYRLGGLLDVHYITDEDLANHVGHATKIETLTDAVQELPLKNPQT